MTTSFKDAFGVLQRNAATLRTQTEPNIDELLPMVQESIEAYNVCKGRIDAVELALQAALGETAGDERSRDGGEESIGLSPKI